LTEVIEELKAIRAVFGDSPTDAIRQIEWRLPQLNGGRRAINDFLAQISVSTDTLIVALNLKQIAGQVNVMIHALGILISLPRILEEDEAIESVSLGAGNTGKKFDLVTDRRVAEFKFIQWRGGSESIRQNNVFKDFLNLLWDTSGKRRQLFLTRTEEAISFLNGGRALSSVLSKNDTIKTMFEHRYGTEFKNVGEFYRKYQREVEILDLRSIAPVFGNIGTNGQALAGITGEENANSDAKWHI